VPAIPSWLLEPLWDQFATLHQQRGMGTRAAHPETWWPSRCPARISGVTSCRSPGRGGSTRRWRRRPGRWHSRVRRCPGSVEGT